VCVDSQKDTNQPLHLMGGDLTAQVVLKCVHIRTHTGMKCLSRRANNCALGLCSQVLFVPSISAAKYQL
jgi:hypothetical protein